MRAILQAAALLLTVSACNQAGESVGNEQRGAAARYDTNQQAESHEVYQQRLLALPERQREAVFLRAILDADLPCERLSGSRQGGEYRGFPVWTATCLHGDSWTLVIGDGGVVQVLNPIEADAVGLGGNVQTPAADNAQ